MAQSTGKQLGPYRIQSRLGKGGMGEVFRAQDTRLGREVAIKVLPERLTQDPEALERLDREARALAALSHPNILTVHDVGREENISYVVTELLEGETLRDRLMRSAVPLRKALEIGIAIAEGLSAAHSRGVIHRDLKPENIFLTSEGHVKILDFGLARIKAPSDKQHSTETKPGTVLGTVDYMSPEQVRALNVDARSDLFSVGCVLYEMVSGKAPFARDTTPDTMAAVLKEEAPSLVDAGVPMELDRIIQHCLEKNPEQRFQTARDLAFDLRAIWHDSGIARTTASVPAAARSRTPKIAILSGAVLALAAIAWLLIHSYSPRINSLAVLPFLNEARNPDADYVCDGLTESIINSLSRLPKLRVMARSTVFRYKGKEPDPQEIGRSLKVGAVLTGRILQKYDGLVIKTELVNVDDGTQIWGEQYARNLSSLMGVDQEITREVSNHLKLELSGEEQKQLSRKHTDSNEAFRHYLKGRYYWNKRTGEDLTKGIEYFQKAADADPNYALAYAGLADVYSLLTDYTGVAPDQSFPRARAAAERALAIDSDLAEAHNSLAQVKSLYDWDWTGAESEFRRAIELSPNYATAHHWFGWHLAMMGRHSEALAEIKKAQDLDPLSQIISANSGLFHYFARQYDPAMLACRKILQVDPNVSFAHYYQGMALEQKKNLTAAESEFQKAHKLSPDNTGVIAAIGRNAALQGRIDEAQQMLDRLEQMAQQSYISPVYSARIYTGLGDPDQVIAWLEKGYAARDELMLWMKVDPRFDKVRKDPRFLDLMRRIRFP